MINSALKREQLTKDICARLNNFVDIKNTLISIISEIKELTGFSAISIRLHENGDYPYYVYNGFPESFIKKDNYLCKDKPDSFAGGKLTLDCLCGNVIRGKVDISKPYYTEKGSYFTNNSTAEAENLLKNETTTTIRNHCSACGYKSVGLFPIKTREENIGLLQLNDIHTDMFTPETVEFIEMLGEQIGIALENALLYEKLKNKNSELQNTIDELKRMQNQLLEAKKLTALADMVTGVSYEIYEPVSNLVNQVEALVKTARTLPKSTESEKIISQSKDIYKQLNDTKSQIKSFRSIAYEQFHESRHLINLKDFFVDVIRIAQASLKKKNIQFKIGCAENTELMCFSGALSQILAILIQNSYLHGFKNSNTGIVEINCGLNNEDFINIRYSDNGTGIPEDIRHKIFEPFFSSDKKNFTGLGLHVAKTLVSKNFNGDITLESSNNVGTTFLITLAI